ncbi:MAG TPA: hypothetical protein VF361_06320 [Candidatus Limnocylindrales bacterium]
MSVAIRPARKRSAVEQADGAAPHGDADAGTATRGKPSRTPAVDMNRVGIVLVHGIGPQPPCDTFLD